MDKGINTEIESTRRELENLLNEKLKLGIPVSIISLILENVLLQIRGSVDVVLKKEFEENKSNDMSNENIESNENV